MFNLQGVLRRIFQSFYILCLLRCFNWLLRKSLKCDRNETIIKFALKLLDFLNWFLMENVLFRL